MKKLFFLIALVSLSISAMAQVDGEFSVSETKKVTFSPGNLQYHKASNTWRFAEDQLTYLGKVNSEIAGGNDWIDLFGWSGGIINKYYATDRSKAASKSSKNGSDNRDPKFGVSMSIAQYDYFGSFVDWGMHQINGDSAEVWRTLTSAEWNYIFEGRKNASELWSVGQVWGVNGLILLPDNWVAPKGVAFEPGYYDEEGEYHFSNHQTFTEAQWKRMEAAGAVFLPASGYRFGADASNEEYCGYYWSATADGTNKAYCLYFVSNGKNVGSNYRHYGHSVRLVKDKQ